MRSPKPPPPKPKKPPKPEPPVTDKEEDLGAPLAQEEPQAGGSIRAKAWTLKQIDDALVASGWPPVSPRWWEVLDKVYSSRQRNVVGRWGRRGGKSSTIAGRVALFEILSGRHEVPPGDVGYFAILSADKDQAKERLDTCAKALTAIGIVHRKTATEITFKEDSPYARMGIKAFAATTSAVVSFTCIGFMCDEMAHWRDKDTGANPASAILKLLRPTMATMKNAKGWYVSAPFSTIDLHHKMFTKGETQSQLVFFGTTPEMNPTLTDEMIVELEEDEPTRKNAYYCIPISADETKFFPASFIDLAVSTPPPLKGKPSRTAAGADFAFRRNSSALAVLDKFEAAIPIQRRKATVMASALRIVADEERIPGELALVPSTTISDLCGIAQMLGADSVACDLHYIETVREETDELEMPLLEFPTDTKEISNAYVRFRVLLTERRVDLSEASPRLIKQLKETTQKPTQSGLSIMNKTTSDGAHGDRVSALICGSWAHDQELIGDDATMGDRRFSRGGATSNDEEYDELPPARFLE